MRIRATVAALTALVITMPAAAHAQRTVRTSSAPAGAAPIELGVDGLIGFGLDDANDGTTIAIPAAKVRAGFFLGDVISVEPSLGFYRFSSQGSSMSTLNLDLSMLYHFGLDRNVNQFYVRPLVGLARTAFDNPDPAPSGASNDISLGVAGGIKMPIMNRVAFRSDLEFRHTLADGSVRPAFNDLNLNFGLSFFTR